MRAICVYKNKILNNETLSWEALYELDKLRAKMKPKRKKKSKKSKKPTKRKKKKKQTKRNKRNLRGGLKRGAEGQVEDVIKRDG